MSKLKEGSKAPLFKAPAVNGEAVDLKDLLGKNVVLYFYPRDLTPGCTIEAQDFQAHLASFKKKKAVVIGVSRDPIKKHEKFCEKYGLTFPLVADIDGEVCKSYGVWQKKKFMGKEFMGIVRSTFIIDTKGKIKKIISPVSVKGHVEEVLNLLSQSK